MARYAYAFPPINWSNYNADLSDVMEQHVERMRDYLRNGDGNSFGVINEALPSKFKVSDIGQWGNASYPLGYAFIVRDTNAGCEWMFAFSGEESNNNKAEVNDWWDDDKSHFQNCADTPAASGSTGSSNSEVIIVYFNPDYATDTFATPFGFDNATELTYSGGDYTDVTTNPNVDFSEWLPTGVLYPKGFLIDQGGSSEVGEHSRIDMVFDDTYDVLTCYYAQGDEMGGRPLYIWMLGGEYCIPNAGGDTNLAGGIWLKMDPSGAIGGIQRAYGQGFDDAGVRIHDYELSAAQSYTSENERTAGGDYKWKAVGLVSPSNDKGHVHTDLMREIGAFRSWAAYGLRFNAPSATEPMVKITESYATPWADGLPAPPVPIPALPDNMDF